MPTAAPLDLEAWWHPNTTGADAVLCCVALGKSLPLSDKQKQPLIPKGSRGSWGHSLRCSHSHRLKG